jgi:hypothetical protein
LFEAENAVRRGATFAEVGAASKTSRQAARQRHVKKVALQEARRREVTSRRPSEGWDDYDDAIQYDDDEEGQHDPWPPRSWRFRAPHGHHTVVLNRGPLNGQEYRIPVGDDAFPLVDNMPVFGTSFARHARYRPSQTGSKHYTFSGEFYLR